MAKFFSFLLIFVSTGVYSQITFENGYFIDNHNHRFQCLIRNADWRNNPNEFEYKLNEEDEPKKGNLSTVKEFGVLGYSKFIRADTQIDRSSDNLNTLTTAINPIWTEERLFLKVLVEGEATLYYYTEGNLERFFYSIADSLPQQLVYKKYLTKGGAVASNQLFRHQLWKNVSCEGTFTNASDKIRYYKKDLENYFIQYNECTGVSYVVYNFKDKRDLFNLKITPGINYASVAIDHVHGNLFDVDFSPQTSYRLGIEAEFILPFNKNKWGIILEPTYQYFHSEKQVTTRMASINYQSVEFPLGLRYYLFVNDNLKFFVDGYYISSFALNFDSTVNFGTLPLDISNGNSMAFGGGINVKRFSGALRLYSNRKILNLLSVYATDYTRVSMILGFKLL